MTGRRKPKQDPNVILSDSEYLSVCCKAGIVFENIIEQMNWICEPNENLEGKAPLYCAYGTVINELERLAKEKNIELD